MEYSDSFTSCSKKSFAKSIYGFFTRHPVALASTLHESDAHKNDGNRCCIQHNFML